MAILRAANSICFAILPAAFTQRRVANTAVRFLPDFAAAFIFLMKKIYAETRGLKRLSRFLSDYISRNRLRYRLIPYSSKEYCMY